MPINTDVNKDFRIRYMHNLLNEYFEDNLRQPRASKTRFYTQKHFSIIESM